MSEQAGTLHDQIKRLIVEELRLEGLEPSSIGDDDPLFGEGLKLDSIDALELVVAMEQEFGIRIQSQDVGKQAFASVNTLATFVREQRASASKDGG